MSLFLRGFFLSHHFSFLFDTSFDVNFNFNFQFYFFQEETHKE